MNPRNPLAQRPPLLTAVIISAFALMTTAHAQFSDPFSVSAELAGNTDDHTLSISFTVPDHHYLYEDKIAVTLPPGIAKTPVDIPTAEIKNDPVSGEKVSFYTGNVTLSYRLTGNLPTPLAVTVDWQGCDESQCFFPQTRTLSLTVGGEPAPAEITPPPTPPPAETTAEWRSIADRFTIARKASGYLPPGPFSAFLDGKAVEDGESSDSVTRSFREKGVLLTVIFTLLGGLMLNLTPCVLPMIPINLAIIGAGAQASSRKRGFALGATYGAGIAAVYGALGLAVVLTGARFGQINSSPWFNFAIALLFALLSLAMLGVFNLDLSRFQGGSVPNRSGRGSFVAAFMMGGVAALLAGACVAPAVISVLLLSTDLYQRGNTAALLLPFLLGTGMAMPWPFAGAGLAFLPKPGAWMERIKQGFGVIILGAALYYGHLGYGLLVGKGNAESFGALLTRAEKTGKPVLIDFWATWCKNCGKMEKTTFHDPAVVEQLNRFTVIKYQAEDLNDPEVKAVLTYYGALGLPTYVVLKPE